MQHACVFLMLIILVMAALGEAPSQAAETALRVVPCTVCIVIRKLF